MLYSWIINHLCKKKILIFFFQEMHDIHFRFLPDFFSQPMYAKFKTDMADNDNRKLLTNTGREINTIPFLIHITHLPRGLLLHDTNPRPTWFFCESRQTARDERLLHVNKTADSYDISPGETRQARTCIDARGKRPLKRSVKIRNARRLATKRQGAQARVKPPLTASPGTNRRRTSIS